MSILEKLTEGIVSRDLRKEGAALLTKWERTGLLEGIENDTHKQGMARLLENQAKELLREASSMAGGDVEGFAAVAFPIVRRVFGSLIANDLVSVQPMSLPSGLIFFLDFTYNSARLGTTADASIYGGFSTDGQDRNVVGSMLTGGINLAATGSKDDSGGLYGLTGQYSLPTGSFDPGANATYKVAGFELDQGMTNTQKKLIRFDPDLLAEAELRADGSQHHEVEVVSIPVSAFATGGYELDTNNLSAIAITDLGDDFSNTNDRVIRRLTHLDPDNTANVLFVIVCRNGHTLQTAAAEMSASDTVTIVYPIKDKFSASNAVGSVVGADSWGLEGADNTGTSTFDGTSRGAIPEIDIKVDSVAVTAITRKLKAKWSPELGQDLNAYHNLDAEVELTSILSEQIALEIDREILQDLVKGATAGTYYWSRSPGLFVNRETGSEVGSAAKAPDFTGTVSEWYETLLETVNDISAAIHRKTLRGGANFIVTSPEVANILEFTAGFRASVTADVDRGTAGALKIGTVSKKWDIYVDPYFPRNLVLVGRKGNSFLESGYVYAPYVPLQVTPTIFGTEDFVPRKGVMTRYAKKMVRPDFYGLVVVRGLVGEGGATS